MKVSSQPLNYVAFASQDYLHTDADEAAPMKVRGALTYSCTACVNHHTVPLGAARRARADS